MHTTQCPEVGVRGRAVFESNRVAGSGGAFYGGSCDKVTLDNAVFRSNDATWGGEGTTGLPLGIAYEEECAHGLLPPDTSAARGVRAIKPPVQL